MFERFTERARHAVVLAQDEARAFKHNYIGTEHILLGLLREEDGIAAQVLLSLEITIDSVRAQVVRTVGTGEEEGSGPIPFTPRAKRVLELALREALSLRHNYTGTEHILLALVREQEGVAAGVLLEFQADPEKIRNRVVQMLPGQGTGPPAKLDFDPVIRVGTSANVHRLLRVAAARALDDDRDLIEVSDILLALSQDQRTAKPPRLDPRVGEDGSSEAAELDRTPGESTGEAHEG